MKSTISSLFGKNQLRTAARQRAMRKKSFETLESRVLLSADSTIIGLTANLEGGIGEVGKELQQFIRQDPAFDHLVPGVLERQGTGADAVDGSPTLEQILDVSVDVDTGSEKGAGGSAGFGFYSGSGTLADRANYFLNTLPNDFFSGGDGKDERALEAMDFLDAQGNPGQDGNVSWQEAFDVLVVGQITRYLNSTTIGDVNGADGVNYVDAGLQIATFLNGGLTGFGLPNYLTDRFDLNLTATADTSNNALKLRTDLTLSFDRHDRVDLGYEADQLGFVIDPTLPGVSPTATMLNVDAGVHLRKFVFGFTGAADGTVTSSDFVFAVPDKPGDPNDGLVIGAEIDQSNTFDEAGSAQQRSFDVNVGFLGASVSSGNFLLSMDAFGSVSDPSNPDALGFSLGQQGPANSAGSITSAAAPEPGDFRLGSDVIFTLKVGNQSPGQVFTVTVPKANTTTNTTLADLVADVDAAIGNASADLGGLVVTTDAGGKVRLSLTADPSQLDASSLGFANEQIAAGTITAGSVSSLIGTMPTGTPVKFLFSAAGGVPKLVTVTVAGDPAGPDGLTGDGDDPEDDDNGQVSLSSLKSSLQSALDAAFGGGTLTVSDNGSSKLRISGTGALEITRTVRSTPWTK